MAHSLGISFLPLRSITSHINQSRYLDAHVQGGYQYLMQNWREDDRIAIFGFSRGAYIARALAGMITKIGLLPRDNTEQISFAYRMYERTDEEGLRQARQFKKTFCRDIVIDFLGVWSVKVNYCELVCLLIYCLSRDTVASTGILSHTLPFTTNNASIRYFRHALSLDERRSKFAPTFYSADVAHMEYNGKSGKRSRKAKRSEHCTCFLRTCICINVRICGCSGERACNCLARTPRFPDLAPTTGNATDNMGDGPIRCNEKEVWFAGCHSGEFLNTSPPS